MKQPWKALQLELFTGDRDSQSLSVNTGFRVVLFNESDVLPVPVIDGIDVSNGKESNIGLSKQYIARVPDTNSICYDTNLNNLNSALRDLFNLYGAKLYFQDSCLRIYLQEAIASKCSCYYYKLPVPLSETKKLSCPLDKENCIKNVTDNYERSNNNANCPFSCEQISYKLNLNTANYPSYLYFSKSLIKSEGFKKVTNGTTLYSVTDSVENYTLVQDACLKINIYFDSMYYSLIQESLKKNFVNLVTDIGSNLGLFVGMSFLSFAELFEIIYLLIININLRFFFKPGESV